MGLYILVCVLLIAVILMQTGRGGGLVESASAAEAIFGGKTNIYMVKITMVVGSLFLALALGLNYYAVQKNKSIIEKLNKAAKRSSVKNTTPIEPPKAFSKEEKTADVDKSLAEEKVDLSNSQKNTDDSKGQAEQVSASKAEEKPLADNAPIKQDNEVEKPSEQAQEASN